MKKLFILITLLSVLLSYNSQVSVMTPDSLRQTYLEKYGNSGGAIPMVPVFSSNIPNNKTIRGYIYYSDKNDLCNSEVLPEIDHTYYDDMDIPDNAIFFMVKE